MDRFPKVGERVRIGTGAAEMAGTVVRVSPVRRQVEVKLDSGLSLSVDAICLLPDPEPVKEPG
jgi:sRNA-binding protein